MKIEITISNDTARIWKYYLRRKRGNKAELPNLLKREIYSIVAAEAQKELKEQAEAKP